MKKTQISDVAPLSEGQRLIELRRGGFSRWVKNHPVGTNCVLALVCTVFQTLFLVISAIPKGLPHGGHAVMIVFSNIVFITLIFLRKRAPLLLLLLSVSVDTVYSVWVGSQETYSLAGFTPGIFLYTVAAELTIRWAIFGYIFSSLCSSALILFIYLSEPIDMGEGVELSYAQDPVAIATLIGFSVGMTLALNLVVVMIGRFTHKNNEFDREVVERFDQTQILAATEERTRIAREMHDVVAHSLTVMITLADGARIVNKKNPARAESALLELSNTGRKALADTRRTLGVLRDPGETLAPLAPAEGASTDAVENLEELVESFVATGLPVSFVHEGEKIPADNNLRLSLYRIVQESLTNALRYGREISTVEVSVKVQLPDIWVRVMNDGNAALDSSGSHLANLGSGKGLTGIRERASFYGGSVSAGMNDVGGWTLRAHLQWKPSTLDK